MDKEENQLSIKLVKEPLQIADFIPTYSYKFEEANISDEAPKMVKSFYDFLETNKELIVDDEVTSENIEGFKKALALFKLWIDSIYIIK